MVPLFNKVKSIARIKILDWYIFKQFLVAFFFIVLNFTLVICMIDLVEKNDDFIKNKPGLYKIVFDYYLNFIPYMANLLSPITVFITSVFVTSRLASRTEIIAMLSSGMSFKRLLVPYLVSSGILALFIYYLVGYIIPHANKIRLAFEYRYVNSAFHFGERNFHLKIGPTTFFYIQSYDNSVHEGFVCTLEDIEGNHLKKKIKADRVRWVPELKKWRLETVRIFDFTSSNTGIKTLTSLDTTLALFPKDFENQHLLNERLSNPELTEKIKMLRFRGADNVETFLVERYLRQTYPFSIVILTLIGVILSARKSREGSGLKIALGFVLAFVYILFFIMSKGIAESGNMPAMLAVWLPNIVFSCIGTFMYFTVPR
jgi:lipopolysaccharide export system permease protein